MTPLTANLLTKQISEVINNFEPRARLVSVNANPQLDRNEYEVTIQFYVINMIERTCHIDNVLRKIEIMAERLNITELDFDNIKQNLKTYLSKQKEFTDYDFEGSGMVVLLDLLSYNTHYNALYSNMLANEMFLDSADLRNSVVSHAKQIGYTARSARAIKVTLNVTVNDATTATVTMARGTAFTTTIDGVSYQYVTNKVLYRLR